MSRAPLPALALAALVPLAGGCTPEPAPPPPADEVPHVSGTASPVEAGRYLVTLGGCHDCHTPGFFELGFDVPEAEWLTGWPVGWQGPWGTTYARNLRLTVARMSEDEFVQMLRTRKALPPMPWMNINRMSEPDVRAIYRYITSLGPGGEPMPAPLAPGEEPTTPYIVLAPPQGLP